MGPMADDFNALGGEGIDHINTLDVDGVAARMAALEQGHAVSGSARSLDPALAFQQGLGVLLVAAGAVWVSERRDGLR